MLKPTWATTSQDSGHTWGAELKRWSKLENIFFNLQIKDILEKLISSDDRPYAYSVGEKSSFENLKISLPWVSPSRRWRWTTTCSGPQPPFNHSFQIRNCFSKFLCLPPFLVLSYQTIKLSDNFKFQAFSKISRFFENVEHHLPIAVELAIPLTLACVIVVMINLSWSTFHLTWKKLPTSFKYFLWLEL